MQPNALSVQQTIEEALSILLKEKVRLTGAGRTDTGVHASYFVAHFSSSSELLNTPGGTTMKLNHMLPNDIAILSIFPVKENFHSRFNALSRTYKYYISRRKNPFRQETSYHISADIDTGAMNRAAKELFNYCDFSSFCRTNTNVKTNICKIISAEWHEEKDMLVFTIRADRFLRNMVRAIVGTMLNIGYGRNSVDEFREIIESKDRRRAGTSAPAQGLFLTEIEYPCEVFSQKSV